MRLFNKFVESKKEPLNKNDIWFDGSVFRIYKEEEWRPITLTQEAIDRIVEYAKSLDIYVMVDELPDSGEEGKIYVLQTIEDNSVKLEEYIWKNNGWKLVDNFNSVSLVLDNELSETSHNAIANFVVTNKFKEVDEALKKIPSKEEIDALCPEEVFVVPTELLNKGTKENITEPVLCHPETFLKGEKLVISATTIEEHYNCSYSEFQERLSKCKAIAAGEFVASLTKEGNLIFAYSGVESTDAVKVYVYFVCNEREIVLIVEKSKVNDLYIAQNLHPEEVFVFPEELFEIARHEEVEADGNHYVQVADRFISKEQVESYYGCPYSEVYDKVSKAKMLSFMYGSSSLMPTTAADGTDCFFAAFTTSVGTLSIELHFGIVKEEVDGYVFYVREWLPRLQQSTVFMELEKKAEVHTIMNIDSFEGIIDQGNDDIQMRDADVDAILSGKLIASNSPTNGYILADEVYYEEAVDNPRMGFIVFHYSEKEVKVVFDLTNKVYLGSQSYIKAIAQKDYVDGKVTELSEGIALRNVGAEDTDESVDEPDLPTPSASKEWKCIADRRLLEGEENIIFTTYADGTPLQAKEVVVQLLNDKKAEKQITGYVGIKSTNNQNEALYGPLKYENLGISEGKQQLQQMCFCASPFFTIAEFAPDVKCTVASTTTAYYQGGNLKTFQIYEDIVYVRIVANEALTSAAPYLKIYAR